MSRSHLTGHIQGGGAAGGDVGTKRRQSSAAPSNLATVCLLPPPSLSPSLPFPKTSRNSVAGRGAFLETEKGEKRRGEEERKNNEAGYYRWERDREEREGRGGGGVRVKLQMQRNRSPPTT